MMVVTSLRWLEPRVVEGIKSYSMFIATSFNIWKILPPHCLIRQ